MNPQYSPEYDHEKTKGKLIVFLKKRTAVLMVGAGSSSIVGYPVWKELLIELRNQFYPKFQDPPEGVDLSDYAQKIKDKIITDGREEDYIQFLAEKFQPFGDKKNYTEFHISLLSLGFCGIVTTNYDKVLEIAVQASPKIYKNPHNCEPLDLCGNKPYLVFPFIRSLNPGTKHSYVLHLHGCYQTPEKIILTLKDYEKNYGILDEHDEKSQKILDTLHRKVIWALLTTHTHLFVGFSLTDPFFLDIIKTVNKDFRLRRDCIHYAIMGYHDDKEMSRIIRELLPLGICPIFYKIDINSDGTENRTSLIDIISELQQSLAATQRAAKRKIITPKSDLDSTQAPVTTLPPLSVLNSITGGNE